MKLRCPGCGFENIEGSDRCEQCLHTLMQRDLPRPREGEVLQNVLMTAPVGELLTGKDLLVASPTDSIEKIVKIFEQKKKDCVLIYKSRKIVGLISQRDLLLRVAGKYKDLSKVTAAMVMTRNPQCVRTDAPIAYIVNQMALGGCRHVPVLAADGSPISIININDVLRYLSRRKKEAVKK